MTGKLRLLLIGTLALVVFAACANLPIRLGPSPGPRPTIEVTEFCADFTAAGGDAGTVGPLELSKPREQLSEQIRVRLEYMGDLEPPPVIETPWNNYKNYFIGVQLALADQQEGSTLDDDDLVQRGLELYGQSRIVRNFYLVYCDA